MNRNIKGKYIEYLSSVIGAGIIGFGLGALFSSYLNNNSTWLVIIIGVVIHGWGMYKIHSSK